jgi:hypothetical protein
MASYEVGKETHRIRILMVSVSQGCTKLGDVALISDDLLERPCFKIMPCSIPPSTTHFREILFEGGEITLAVRDAPIL